jgi:hypothetical protein
VLCFRSKCLHFTPWSKSLRCRSTEIWMWMRLFSNDNI